MVGVQRSRAERDGKRLDVGNCIVFRFFDLTVGLLQVWEHFDDLYVWDEFWSEPLRRRGSGAGTTRRNSRASASRSEGAATASRLAFGPTRHRMRREDPFNAQGVKQGCSSEG